MLNSYILFTNIEKSKTERERVRREKKIEIGKGVAIGIAKGEKEGKIQRDRK